jgi:hypothetical protein
MSSFYNAKKEFLIIKADNSNYISPEKVKGLEKADLNRLCMALGVLDCHNYITLAEGIDFIVEIFKLMHLDNNKRREQETVANFMERDLIVSLQKKFDDIFNLSVSDRETKYSVSYYDQKIPAEDLYKFNLRERAMAAIYEEQPFEDLEIERTKKLEKPKESSKKIYGKDIYGDDILRKDILEVITAYTDFLKLFESLCIPKGDDDRKNFLLYEITNYVNDYFVENRDYIIEGELEKSLGYTGTIRYFKHIIDKEQLLFFTKNLLFRYEPFGNNERTLIKFGVIKAQGKGVPSLISKYIDLRNKNSKDEKEYLSIINSLKTALSTDMKNWLLKNSDYSNEVIDSICSSSD